MSSDLTPADSFFIVLVGGAVAFAVWFVALSLSWQNRRVSLWSLMILMLLMAVAFALLTLLARSWVGWAAA